MSCRSIMPAPIGLCTGLTMFYAFDFPSEDGGGEPPECTDCEEWAEENYTHVNFGLLIGGGTTHSLWAPDSKTGEEWQQFLANVAEIRELNFCDVPFDFEILLWSSNWSAEEDPEDQVVALPVQTFISSTIAQLEAMFEGFAGSSGSAVYFRCDQPSIEVGTLEPIITVTPTYHRDVRGDAIGGYFADPTDAAYNVLLKKAMALVRTNRSTGEELDVEDGIATNDAGLDFFNGGGMVNIPAPTGEFDITRDNRGFSVAVYWWPAAANNLSDQPGGDTDTQPQQILGFGGERDGEATAGLSIVLQDQTAADLQITVSQEGGQSWNLPTFPSNSRAPFVLVAVIHRAGGSLWLTLYRDGAPFGDPIAIDPDLIEPTVLTVGDQIKSDGGWNSFAAWCRPLLPSQVAELGTDLGQLTVCDGRIGNFGNPLLTPWGHSAIDPQFIVPRVDRSATLATEGMHRHTRISDQHRPRQYTLRWTMDDGHDLDLIRQVIEQTRGCTITRWRHPVDDPVGPVSEAPRWIILNADELRQMFAVTRDRPHVAGFTLELEEVI